MSDKKNKFYCSFSLTIFFQSLLIIFPWAMTNPLLAQEAISHEFFAKKMIEYIDPVLAVSTSSPEECFQILTQYDLSPRGGFHNGAIISSEESFELFSKLALQVKDMKTTLTQQRALLLRGKLTIWKIQGDVLMRLSSNSDWESMSEGQQVSQEAEIKTGNNGQAYIHVGTLGNIHLKKNSHLIVSEMVLLKDGINENVHLDLQQGKLLVNVQGMSKESRFRTSSPSATTSVRGTIYELSVEPDKTV